MGPARGPSRAVAIDPADASANAVLAATYYSQGQWDETEASARRALALNPSSVEGHTWYGWALVYREEYAQAGSVFEEALALSPRGPSRWNLLDGMAGTHFAAGRYAEAVQWTRQVVRERPDYFWSYIRLAAAHAHLGQMDQARTALATGLGMAPDLSQARLDQILRSVPYTEQLVEGLRAAGWEG